MSAPADHQVRNKEICEGQDNGDFDRRDFVVADPGASTSIYNRINSNRGAFRFTFECSRSFHEVDGVQVTYLMLLHAS